MRVLCLDAGSSSLKYAIYEGDAARPEIVRSGTASLSGLADADETLERIAPSIQAATEAPIEAIGHRLVFGGPAHLGPVRIDDVVLHDLEALCAYDPLHLPLQLELVRCATRAYPDVPNVACFDTSFHRNVPAVAKRLPLPAGLDPAIARYGYHGLSYEYVASQLEDAPKRAILAHLGSGASLCALKDGLPIDTTMGFSTLGGLMMGSRPGDLDPGVVLHLLRSGHTLETLTEMFYLRSGLAGVSNSTGDMRSLLERSPADDGAHRAVELFIYQLIKYLGACVAVLGGLDRLVFTGGIGERAPSVRSASCAALAYLGVSLDEAANARNDRTISRAESAVRVEVIPTNEALTIARHTLQLLASSLDPRAA